MRVRSSSCTTAASENNKRDELRRMNSLNDARFCYENEEEVLVTIPRTRLLISPRAEPTQNKQDKNSLSSQLRKNSAKRLSAYREEMLNSGIDAIKENGVGDISDEVDDIAVLQQYRKTKRFRSTRCSLPALFMHNSNRA